ncbi:uncharacterized protein EV420DRAFT_254443 [Desarmillaria tabescens]|uniref:Uncharacterized protein n=1 Tax=Armillaria tabescens TaxID=1929756 RepID=A0AA39N7A1_ARMTA|nr:uncharacterized protein EV420DRAFT_254443 [Desarmillaria tabescens]KAK0460173.1 hypothetical protein EV420DRAFT_254443 [Desarmillaria tabescens]
MASAIFFKAYLTLGQGQSHSCRELYAHVQHTPTKLRALARLNQGAFALRNGEKQESPLIIDDPDSSILGRDQFFRLLVELLKDPQIPISSLELSGLSWFNVPDVGSWHAALTSFPNVSSLCLQDVKCDEVHFLALIRSFPTLKALQLDENQIRAYEVTRSLGVENLESRFASIEDIRNGQRGPELEALHIGITTISDQIMIDLFVTRNSPVALHHLRELVIRDYAKFVCDISFARRLNMLLKLTTDLFDLDLDNFNITRSLPPLDIPNLHWFRFTIHLNHAYQMDQAIFWWINTLLHLPRENQLRMITVTVEVDTGGIPSRTPFPRDLSAWTALDRAMCRDEIQLEELFVKVCAPEDDGRIFRWICTRCLPVSRQRYVSRFTGDNPCFTLLNDRHQVVDLNDFL